MSSITLSTHLEKSKVALGKKHEVHLLVSLEGKKDEGKRKPLCLGVAIDLSSSMQGRKFEDAKAGLQKLVEHLTDQDTLTIVAFSSSVWTVLEPVRMTQDAKDRIKADIHAMHTHSATNLSGATFETYAQVRKAAEKKLKDSVSRALVFTDGQPTAGDCSVPGLVAIAKGRPEDTSLIAFGYGEDYNAELMTQMAKVAGGEAYHIKTPDEFAPTLGRVLGGLLSCVAQTVKVTLKTKTDVKILEVLNDFDVKANDVQTEATITVDDVYSQEKRSVLIKLELPEMEKSTRPFNLGTVSIEYQDLLAKEPRTAEAVLKVEYVKEADADKEANKLVAEQIAVLGASKAQEEAMKLAQQGHFAQAKSIIRGAALSLQDVGTVFASSVANDLNNCVQNYLEPKAFAAGGAHYLKANSASYRSSRGQTLGASKLYGTEQTASMEAKFSKPDPVVGSTLPPGVVGNNVFGPGVAPGFPQGGVPMAPGGSAGWPNSIPPVDQGKPQGNAPLNVPVAPKPTLSKKRSKR